MSRQPFYLLLLGLLHIAAPLAWLGWHPAAGDPAHAWWTLSAVSGFGLLWTCLAPDRYWPVWLLLLCQKLAWLGWLWGTPARTAWPFVLWELGWLLCLTGLLRAKYHQFLHTPKSTPDWRLLLENARPVDKPYNWLDKQRHQPLLLFFTRHSGCTFCREMLWELDQALARQWLRPDMVGIVTQSSPSDIRQWWAEYPNLAQVDWVSDPNRWLYQAFRLRRGRLGQLFGWRVWWRGLRAMRFGIGFLDGDGFQMPGVVMVQQETIVAQQVFASAADKVDWSGWRARCSAR